MGKVTQSVETLESMIRYKREVNHPFSQAAALQAGAWISYKLGRLDDCYRYSRELLTLSIKHGFSFFEGAAEFFLGHQIALEINYEEGKRLIVESYTNKLNAGKGKLFNSMYGLILGDIAIFCGHYQQGLEDIEAAIAISMTHGECCYFGEELVMRGRLKMALERTDEALYDYKTAITEAHDRGSKAAELKASFELASYYYAQEQAKEARRVLTPLVLRFVEQQSYLDIEKAKDLLSKIDISMPYLL